MKTNNKCAAVRLEKSKLVAALAILAVAFVVIAAVPAVADDSDATATGVYYVGGTNASDAAGNGTSIDKPFATIKYALEQSDVTKIILNGDLELGNSTTAVTADGISVAKGKTLEIDLNGHMIRYTTVNTSGTTYYAIKNEGTLTISDSSNGATGGISVKGYPIGVFGNTGTLTIDGGHYSNEVIEFVKDGKNCKYVYYLLNNNGNVTINNGSFALDTNTTINSSIMKNGWYTDVKKGGTTENPTYTIVYGNNLVDWDYNAKGKVAKMTIVGGTFTGSTYIKNDFGGDLTISGGTFDTTGSADVFTFGKLTVTGGTFKHASTPIWAYGNADVTVSGGDYTQGGKTAVFIDTNDGSYYDNELELTNTKISFTTADIVGADNLVGFSKIEGSSATGEITIDSTNKITFENLRAGSAGLFIKVGSVKITGTMNGSDAAQITAAAGDVVLKDLTITSGKLILDKNITVDGTLTIDAGAELNLAGTANLTVNGKILVKEKTADKNAAKIVGTGKIAVEEKGSIVVGGTINNTVGLTNNGVISIINEKAEIPATIAGNGSVDISAVASEGTISGDWNTVTTYTQNQTITLTGDTFLKEGSQIIVKGKMIIPEGVTLTIEDGAQLVIYSSTGILENNGKIVVQSSVGAVSSWNQLNSVDSTGGLVNIGAEIINDGVIDLSYTLPSNASEDQKYATHPQFNNSGKLTNNGQIEVGSESFLYFWGGMTNSADATITVLGLIQHDANGEQISNAGIISFNGAIRENGMSIALTSADAKVDFVSLESIIGTNTITVKNDLKASGSNTYNGIPAVAVSVAKDFTVKGLVVTPAVVLQENSKTAYDRYVVIEGSVICDTEKETVPSASPVVITVTGKIKVDAALALGAGVDMKIGSTSPATSGELYVNGTMTSVAGKINNSNEFGQVSIVSGNVTVTGKITASKTLGTTGINAAFYKIDKTTTAPESYVYTTLDQAIADGAKKIEIYGTTKVSVDVAVPSGTTVKVNTGADLKITEDSKVTIASGAVLNNLASDFE